MYTATVFLPLLGFLIVGLFGTRLGNKASNWITCTFMGVACLLSWMIFNEVALGSAPKTIELFTWISSGSLDISWALRFDTLTAVMLIVVNTVSFMVHVYSVGYMSHDNNVPRFMAYLSLFTFAMLMLVTGDNLVQLFFGWEGVGLASYLLIGFWHHKPTANAAAIKAFVVNRVGDFGFALGIFGIYLLFDSVNFDTIFAAAPDKADTMVHWFGLDWNAMTIICLLLFIGAMGKSAQIGLHTWLPDAMEGPTPVSALIHAATMVTAGVFMVTRMSPMFELSETALMVVTVVGATTAFFAATVGCVQNDIKRVIAYSTCSQLGYMFFAIGVSAYPAAIFHLMTHAFFKALLFLGAGSVIHAMSDEQDIRNMGGIWKKIPFTYAMMWIGSLALVGIPFFAGYYSKDMILESAFGAHSWVGQYAFIMGIAAAFMTAFYSWRLIIMTFHGKPRADEKVMDHIHESPVVMTAPLFVLAVGALFAGYLGYENFVGHNLDQFWNGAILMLPGHDSIDAAHHSPLWVKLAPLVVGIVGISLAYFMYMFTKGIPQKLSAMFNPMYKFMLNKWYFDEMYDAIFVRPAFGLGRLLWKSGDENLIDAAGPDGLASMTQAFARFFGRVQSGYVFHYAFAMIVGVAALATWLMVGS